jgi:hypothetical protein
VVPHEVAAHWFWVGSAIVLAFWLARYVVGSRRVGRKPNYLLILAFLGLLAFGALWSRVNGPWQALILLLVPVVFGWAWFRRDRTKIELGPDVLAVDMWVERITPSLFFPSVRGQVRLFVGNGPIATRTVQFGGTFPGWLANFGLLTYTFRAADCEVDRPLMGVSSFLVSHGKPSLVLRGTDRRGEVELALSRPSAVTSWGHPDWPALAQPTLEDVQRELIRAGARPASRLSDTGPLRPGPVIEPDPLPVASVPANRTGDEPPYWPPPPGWAEAHRTPATRSTS